jgi:hypothetical protein
MAFVSFDVFAGMLTQKAEARAAALSCVAIILLGLPCNVIHHTVVFFIRQIESHFSLI